MAQHLETDETFGPRADDLASSALALARRFAAGATLWCWAPGAAEHAQHVAVEFVHPVIVGKRALPAVAIAAAEPEVLGTLRALVRAGDVLIVVGAPLESAVLRGVLQRAPSWGATTIWIGAGARPEAGGADHVLWFDGDEGSAASDGGFVLAYHLLWELTHVCFEHPGLLIDDPACAGPVCTTCSDEGRLAEVVGTAPATATVRTAAGLEKIDTSVVGDLRPGDLVLVHAGTALTIVDEAR